MVATSLLTSARYGRAKPVFVVVEHASNRLVFGGLGLVGLLDEIGLGDPAGDDARLHDHVLRLIARGFVGIEDAGMLGRLAAFLALGPADQIVGGATGQILDRLYVVLA